MDESWELDVPRQQRYVQRFRVRRMHLLADVSHVDSSMIELPICRWRGDPTVEEHHRCSSPKLTHGPNGVLDQLCFDCSLCNHELEDSGQAEARQRQQENARAELISAGLTGEQVQNFIGWLGNSAALGVKMVQAYKKWWLAGCPRPTQGELAERRAACEACPHLRRPSLNRSVCSPSQDSCGLCGCPISSVASLFGLITRPGKAEMSTETCPDNPPRWKKLL